MNDSSTPPEHQEQMTSKEATANAEAAKAQAKAIRPWYKKPLPLIGIVVLFVIGINAVSGGDSNNNPSPAASATSVNEEASAEPDVTEEASAESDPRNTEFGMYSDDQLKFVTTILEARQAIDDAETDLAESVLLRARDKNLCEILKSNSVTNWVGKIKDVGANGDGNAYVEIEIAEQVRVETWNNSFSDLFDETLIPPSSEFFNNLISMKKGDKVTWSATFLSDDNSCLKKGNLTNLFYGLDPQFKVRFTDVK